MAIIEVIKRSGSARTTQMHKRSRDPTEDLKPIYQPLTQKKPHELCNLSQMGYNNQQSAPPSEVPIYEPVHLSSPFSKLLDEELYKEIMVRDESEDREGHVDACIGR
ncbi:hypothetical protein BGAL_0154g00070 [Botrytis galanthina]|uniref:Uncharacterized protein n=1 Tax=Botrytis galanthina TaxID=278940 RepID=A0A4S8R0B1_9HELO|nr:hypothetical protein BGAL_0154g00070 [Botrytis galanthina]